MEIKQAKVKIVFDSEEMASLIKAYETLEELENLMFEQNYQQLLTENLNITFNSFENALSILDALSEKDTLEVE